MQHQARHTQLLIFGNASVLPYPESRAKAIVGPSCSPRFFRVSCGVSGRDWWEQLSAADRDEARALFGCMRSDSGFINDLRQGQTRWSAARRDALSKVQRPTLVTGSRHDRGVSFAQAEDLANAIPDAQLVELDSPTHIFWIGPGRARLVTIVRSFIDE